MPEADAKEPDPAIESLLERVAQRDAAAIDEVLQHYLPGLRGFVRLRAGRVVREHEASTDLVQSVCREVLENLQRFQHGGAVGFKRWLYSTALRKIADRQAYYQALKRDVRREVAAPTLEGSAHDVLQSYGTFCTPSRHASAREELARVELAFDDLPEHYRAAIVNVRMLGMSHRELAAQMGKSEGTVRTILSRAMAQLAENLDRHG